MCLLCDRIEMINFILAFGKTVYRQQALYRLTNPHN